MHLGGGCVKRALRPSRFKGPGVAAPLRTCFLHTLPRFTTEIPPQVISKGCLAFPFVVSFFSVLIFVHGCSWLNTPKRFDRFSFDHLHEYIYPPRRIT